ncbi:unnamed protein product [Owenia fusiformis]|uniref:Uncharacterized protein n=1 Tax=Owenia fusiformis TaxID=6347 RepID=A0A8J1THF2_OWEFU|nr:unnamed protein product [Owenia fusiformis]
MAENNKAGAFEDDKETTNHETNLATVDFNVATQVLLKHGLKSTMYKGDFFPNFWPRTHFEPGQQIVDLDWKDWFESFKDFKAREDDVIVSSYPKSGHHWMNEVVYMLQHGTTESANISKGRNFIEVKTMEELESMPSPRLLLTHLKYEHIPKDMLSKGCKMFYMYRNPKDVAVSYFYHIIALESLYDYTGGWNEYFDIMLKEQHEYGRWLDSVPYWLEKSKGIPEILVFSYENLKKDFINTAKKLSAHIGKTYTDEFFENLAEACSIDTMKKNDSLDFARLKSGKPLIRKGQVGNWKNYFTVAQNEQFNTLYNPIIDKLDFEVQFE